MATATAEISVPPDEVQITFAVITEAPTAAQAVQQNAQKAPKVIIALEKAGIPREDIRTEQYEVSPVIDYDKKPSQIIGYRVTNQIRILSRSINEAGKFIDTAISAGANSVNSVVFTLFEESQIMLQNKVLSEAARRAHDRAQAIAFGLQVTLGNLISASESFNMPPRPINFAMARADAPTPISPGPITVSGTVTVVYEIKP